MASRRIEDLVPEAQKKALQVIEICKQKDVDLLIYCTLRTLEEQAKLYRQSRTTTQITMKTSELRKAGYGFLADVIDRVGPCSGAPVTKAAPGESWHNFGEAWDAVPLINGKAAWDYKQSPEAWEIYGQAVRDVGITWGGDWTRFQDLPHAQLRELTNPLKEASPAMVQSLLVNTGLLQA